METGEFRYIDFPYDGTLGRKGRINAEGDYCFIYVRLDNGRPYVEIGYLKDGMFSFRSFKKLGLWKIVFLDREIYDTSAQ